MLGDFQYRHLPALFTAAAQCWGTIWPIINGSTASVMLHYGLPKRITDVPETWPVWQAGGARTACLGILMFVFYAQRRYDTLDTFLIVIGGYLGFVDCIILSKQGLASAGVFRLLGSLVFASLGAIGFTQGPAS
ncbi:hypothetical protein V2G26_001953 [Clonostachys chloroleuca]